MISRGSRDLNRQTARLQTELWTRTVSYAQQDPNPVRAGLLLQSLNQAIDLGEARWMAFQNHVPESVIYVNAAVGLLSSMLVGYSFGVNGRRNIFSMSMLAVSSPWFLPSSSILTGHALAISVEASSP